MSGKYCNAAEDKAVQFLKSKLAITLAVLISFWVGGITALSALRDADTCWLLALGKIIALTGLPESDPFSYTYFVMQETGTAPPFIMHQWLSELLFYLVYRSGGEAALVFLVATLTTVTFTVLPALSLRWAKVSPALCVLTGSLAQLAASFHFFARPELFSYPLFAAALTLVSCMLRKNRGRWLVLAVYGTLSAIWCNIHSSFVLAVALSFLPLVAYFAAQLFSGNTSGESQSGESKQAIHATFLLLPMVSALCTLLNPAGYRLWEYLPRLFFMKIAINETRTLALSDLGTIELYPFFGLLALYLFCLFRSRQVAQNGDSSSTDKRSTQNGTQNSTQVSAPKDTQRGTPNGIQDAGHILLALFACTLSLSRIRLIVYALIVIAFELPYLLSLLKVRSAPTEGSSTQAKDSPASARGLAALLLAPLACLAGTLYVSTALSPPRLPQPMPGFKPPFKAIAYLQAHHPEGPVLNDARYGNMLIWNLEPPVPVFIDTRFDMYGDDFFEQYAMLNNCDEGWQKALSDFAIEWVFLPRDRPLALALSKDPDWKTYYSDDCAVILQRVHNQGNKSHE